MSVSSQFEEALLKKDQKDQKVLLNDEPLTEEDCKFLSSIPVSATLGQSILDLSALTKDIIQGYGIVLKTLESTYQCEIFSSLSFLLTNNNSLFSRYISPTATLQLYSFSCRFESRHDPQFIAFSV